jgi:hypothetical protein
MRRVFSSLVVIAGILAFAPLAKAQSLGEVAAREKEKRKARTGKVYNDDDLHRRGAAAAASTESGAGDAVAAGATATPATAASAAGGKEDAGSAEGTDDRSAKEKAFRERWSKANADLDAAKAELAKIEEQYNNAPDGMKPSYQTQLTQARAKALEAQQAVDKLDDERRFAGFNR